VTILCENGDCGHRAGFQVKGIARSVLLDERLLSCGVCLPRVVIEIGKWAKDIRIRPLTKKEKRE